MSKISYSLLTIAVLTILLMQSHSIVYGQSGADFSCISQAEQLWGPKISPDFLKGKVVFIEYWGIHCPPCRAAMPHLCDLQNEYGKTGVFCIIGNHAQPKDAEINEFLTKTKVNFPIYQSLRLDLSTGGGIPHAFLFDATGKMVADGHPADVSKKVPDAVKQAMELRKLAMPALNLPEGLKHPFADSSLGRFQAAALEMFFPGKPWATNYKKLKKAAESSDNPEAQQALTILDEYLENEVKNLVDKSQKSPAAAFSALDKLNRSLKGMPQEKELAPIYKKFSADKNVKDLSAIIASIDKFNAVSKSMKPDIVKAKATALFKTLKNYCDREKLDPILKKEAFKIAWDLKDKYGTSDNKKVAKSDK